MEQIIFNSTIFLIGLVFGAGSFYGLAISKLNAQNDFNKQITQKMSILEGKIDDIKENIKGLSERISRIEGRLCIFDDKL